MTKHFVTINIRRRNKLGRLLNSPLQKPDAFMTV